MGVIVDRAGANFAPAIPDEEVPGCWWGTSPDKNGNPLLISIKESAVAMCGEYRPDGGTQVMLNNGAAIILNEDFSEIIARRVVAMANFNKVGSLVQ